MPVMVKLKPAARRIGQRLPAPFTKFRVIGPEVVDRRCELGWAIGPFQIGMTTRASGIGELIEPFAAMFAMAINAISGLAINAGVP